MIIQGTNDPITLNFDKIPLMISVSLVNELGTLKHWDKGDLVEINSRKYMALYSQEESMQWDEGPAWIELSYTDEEPDAEDPTKGTVQKARAREYIGHWTDTTVLE